MRQKLVMQPENIKIFIACFKFTLNHFSFWKQGHIIIS